MALRPRQVIVAGLCGLVLTIGLARFAYTPLLPAMQAGTGLGDAAAGLLASVNYLGYMAGALAAAWIDDPRWRHRLFSLGLPVAVACTALMGVAENPWVWGALRFVGGLCGATGMLFGAGLVLSWLMRAGRRPELGTYFTGLGGGILVTAGAAMVFAPLALPWDRQWLWLGAVGLLFLVPAWAWRPPVPPPVPPATAADADAPSTAWMVVMQVMYFCAGWGFVVGATFTVAIVERQPALAGQGPVAWALVGLAATPAVALWDRVARRLGEWRALQIALLLQAAATVLPALSGSLAAALLSAFGYGATFIGIVSMTLALVGRRSPRNPGKAMARLTLGYGLAQVLAPALSGWMAQRSGGWHGALWLTAAVLVAGWLVLTRLPREAAAPPA
jgi:MFS family permease